MTHEEIQAVYASGPEAVIALVEFLLERMAEQEQIIAELRARVKSWRIGWPRIAITAASRPPAIGSSPPMGIGVATEWEEARGAAGSSGPHAAHGRDAGPDRHSPSDAVSVLWGIAEERAGERAGERV